VISECFHGASHVDFARILYFKEPVFEVRVMREWLVYIAGTLLACFVMGLALKILLEDVLPTEDILPTILWVVSPIGLFVFGTLSRIAWLRARQRR